jgi:hypothetical protein
MRYVALVSCIFATACAGEFPSAPSSPSSTAGGVAQTEARGGSKLPFRGALQATETVDGAVHNVFGTGEATHLGRFTLTSGFTVTPPPVTSSGTAVWTAANGDQIFTDTTGQVVAPPPPFLLVRETHVITGGTGRFAHTSGSIVLERSLRVGTYPIESTASISGTINLRE